MSNSNISSSRRGFSGILKDVTNEIKEEEEFQLAKQIGKKLNAQDEAKIEAQKKADHETAKEIEEKLRHEIKSSELAQQMHDLEKAKKIQENLEIEMHDEVVASQLESEEKHAAEREKAQKLKLEMIDYKRSKELEMEMELSEKHSARVDEDFARAEQRKYEVMAKQESEDYEVALQELKKMESEEAKQEAKDKELAKKHQRELNRADSLQLKAAAKQRKELARKDSKVAEEVQQQLDRERHRELAKQRLLEDFSLDGDPKATSEQDAYEAQIDLWNTPRHEFVDVPGGIQLAVLLPDLKKMEVEVAGNRKAICVVAERRPISSPDGGAPRVAELRMSIKMHSGQVRSENISHDYHCGWGIAFIYIDETEMGSMNKSAKESFIKGLKSKFESAFSVRRRSSISS